MQLFSTVRYIRRVIVSILIRLGMYVFYGGHYVSNAGIYERLSEGETIKGDNPPTLGEGEQSVVWGRSGRIWGNTFTV